MVLCIIPAHMDSKRFPGKVLADIEGKPMLERVVDRVLRAKLIDQLCIACDNLPSEKPLLEWVEKKEGQVFVGNHPPKDLLTLFWNCTKIYQPDTIVRVTSDCPLIDPGIIDLTISLHQQSGADYTSNVWPQRTFPDGLDVEVFTSAALCIAHANARLSSDREHVTPYMKRRGTFKKATLRHDQDLSHLRWTVDTPDDLPFVRRVYRELQEPFGMKEILELEIHA